VRGVALAVAALLAAAAVLGAWSWQRFTGPGPLAQDTWVIVPRGEGVDAIADPLLFRLGARIEGADTGLRAGEYAFAARISARAVVRQLRKGDTVVRRLTVLEGLTTAEVVALVAATEGLQGPTGRPPAEGTLLPETYHFSYGDQRRDLLERMAEAMRRTVADLWATRQEGLPVSTPGEAVVLASIIEKETAVAEERGLLVAGVFINRLRKGMSLQSDPTVVYALTSGAGPLGRPLTRTDLGVSSPYNTYVTRGLPPGPIANPGRAALAAAVNPEETDAFYFVADGNGGHAFARTLAEHNRNVAAWRRIQRERGLRR